jgi:hypothetical protein
MYKVKTALLLIAGIILLLPVSGAFGAHRLTTLYSLNFDEPNLLILMRHRAVLFGILGGFICCAAFRPAWQSLALAGGFINVLAFIALAWMTGGYNAALQRVVVADLAALLCLLAALVIHLFKG